METNIIISDNKDYQTKIFDNITDFNNKKNPNMIGTNAWNFGELFGFYVKKMKKLLVEL